MKLLNIFILILGLTTHAFSQELPLAVKSMNHSLEILKTTLEQSVACYEQLGETRYRKSFCENMKGEMRGFDYYAQENEAEVSKYIERLQTELAGPKLPPALKAFKRMIDDEYERCQNETDAGEDYSEPPLPESALTQELQENLIFPYSSAKKSFALNPEVMNKFMMDLVNSAYYTTGPERAELLKRANTIAQKALELRKKIYLGHPELISAMALEVEYPSPHLETFWGNLYEKTGLTKNDFSTEQRDGFAKRRNISLIEGLLYNGYKLRNEEQNDFLSRNKSLVVFEADDKTFSVGEPSSENNVRDEREILSVEVIVRETGMSQAEATQALMGLAASEQKSSSQTTSIANALGGRYREEVLALSVQVAELEEDIDKSIAASRQKNDEDEDAPDYCEDARQERIKSYANLRYLVDFYQDKTNLEFINDNFDRARALMKATIARTNLSQESKAKLQKHLDAAEIATLELDHKTLDEYVKTSSELYFEAKEMAPDIPAAGLIDDVTKQLQGFKRFEKISSANSLMGVNAYYHPDDEGYEGGHRVTCTCGMAGKAVQRNNPDFLLGVMGHELGHALDPSFSSRTRENYSAHSLAMMDELRTCLIKNNNNLWTKSSEDFADHWEALMRAEMIRQDSQKPDWESRKLKIMLEHYSNICEGDENVMEGHSINTYRAYHVMSQPSVRAEFSELNLPVVPFCEVIKLVPAKGSSSEK